MKKNKKTKIIAAVVICLILALAVTAMILLIPRDANISGYQTRWSAGEEFDIARIQTLEKTPGEEFKILQISDTQLWTGSKDNKSALEITDTMIKGTQPDLIVLIGDNVSGLFTDSLLKDLIKTIEKHKIPWAPVFGNHDGEGRATLAWQAKKFIEAEYCMFLPGPYNIGGTGNYVINVTENGEVVNSLIFMDSGANHPDKSVDGYASISYAQIAWYEWNINGINKAAGKNVASSLFFHIPLPEHKLAVESLAKDGNGKYIVPEEFGGGNLGEYVSCPNENTGFFETIKALGSTTHIFVGHDHSNFGAAFYEGVYFVYGLKTGPSPAPWNDATVFGGSVIKIGENGKTSRFIEHINYEDLTV